MTEEKKKSFRDKFAEKTLSYDETKNIPTKVTDEETLTKNQAVFEEETLSHDDDNNHDYDEETLTHNKESYVSDDEILEKMETIMKVSLIQKLVIKKTGRNSYFFIRKIMKKTKDG